MTRSSDAIAPAADPDEGTWWTNHYRCPCCRHEWEDGWDCMVNDECPTCAAREIEPYYSDDGSGTEEARVRALAMADVALEEEQRQEEQARATPAARGG